MNRKQILRRLLESFTAEEIEAINAQERFARNAIAKIINDLNDGTEVIKRSVKRSTKSNDLENNDPENTDSESDDPENKDLKEDDPIENAKEWSYAIADKIFLQEGIDKSSKIYQAIESEIEELLTSPRYIKYAENIFKAIKNSRLLTNDLLGDSLSLSDKVSNDSKVKNFLLDLYNVTLHFGGGNTIGKGELLLAAIISDVKLASHTQKGSKVDIFNIKTNLPIELKHDGGRLDGSGVKPKRFEVSELFDIINDTLKASAYGKPINQLYRDLDEEDWKEPVDLVTRIQDSLKKPLYVTNPFSRKSIEDLWFTDVPGWIEEISDSCALLGIDVKTNEFLTNIFLKIYASIYSEDAIGSIEARFVIDRCKDLAKNCLDTKDIETFVIDDTTIRARIYMRLSKDTDPEKSGYLVFMKPTSDDLTLCCIDYTAADSDIDQWRHKGRKRLHITPGNDDRRASHQIHIK